MNHDHTTITLYGVRDVKRRIFAIKALRAITQATNGISLGLLEAKNAVDGLVDRRGVVVVRMYGGAADALIGMVIHAHFETDPPVEPETLLEIS